MSGIRHQPQYMSEIAIRATLKAIYLKKLGTHMQGLFGQHRGGTRPSRKRVEDIVLGTREIRASVTYKTGTNIARPKLAKDLLRLGWDKLDKVRDAFTLQCLLI